MRIRPIFAIVCAVSDGSGAGGESSQRKKEADKGKPKTASNSAVCEPPFSSQISRPRDLWGRPTGYALATMPSWEVSSKCVWSRPRPRALSNWPLAPRSCVLDAFIDSTIKLQEILDNTQARAPPPMQAKTGLARGPAPALQWVSNLSPTTEASPARVPVPQKSNWQFSSWQLAFVFQLRSSIRSSDSKIQARRRRGHLYPCKPKPGLHGARRLRSTMYFFTVHLT